MKTIYLYLTACLMASIAMTGYGACESNTVAQVTIQNQTNPAIKLMVMPAYFSGMSPTYITIGQSQTGNLANVPVNSGNYIQVFNYSNMKQICNIQITQPLQSMSIQVVGTSCNTPSTVQCQ
ncbi:MAG: hypothetical protein HWD59_07630 [Coxiellaceae bacterium]|nr:MAG: hypothetical protein HWD59_07630 [Coxiellaceae bacterium]